MSASSPHSKLKKKGFEHDYDTSVAFNSSDYIISMAKVASGDHTSETKPNISVSPISSQASSQRSSFGQSQNDIWSPVYQNTNFSLSGSPIHSTQLKSQPHSQLRGKSFGAYGHQSIDSERYRTGNAAWGSVTSDVPKRRLASFPASEPQVDGLLYNMSPISSLHSTISSGGINLQTNQLSSNIQMDFTKPTISILDRFSSLGDATRQIEMNRTNLWSQNKSTSNSMGELHLQQRNPPYVAPSTTPKSSVPSNSMPSVSSASYSGNSMLPLPIPVPIGPSNGLQNIKRRNKKRLESPFIDRLRSAPPNRYSLNDILGNAVEASTDQHGSRFIQDKLTSASAEVRHSLLIEILPEALSLSTDVFGNYVVQLLFQLSSSVDREELSKMLKGHVLMLTLHMYGCRVIQNALIFLSNKGRIHLVEELKGSVLRCIRDHNGNHVIQKAIEHVPAKYSQFIYTDMMEQALALTKHTYGCRVIQRALEYGLPDIKQRLLQIIKANIDILVLDQYGNYVVQHVVQHGPKVDGDFILDILGSKIVTLSSHKYASNVIEICIVKASPLQRSKMVDTIIKSTKNGEPAVQAMIKDQYGNYVIQRILDTVDSLEYELLSQAVKKNLTTVRRSHQGKHLLAIERKLK